MTLADLNKALDNLEESLQEQDPVLADPVEQVETYRKLKTLSSRLSKLKKTAEENARASLEVHGDTVVDDKKFYPSVRTSYKPRDRHAVVDRVMAETGGDVNKLGNCIQSFRTGQVKTLVPDAFEELFEAKETPIVAEGRPE